MSGIPDQHHHWKVRNKSTGPEIHVYGKFMYYQNYVHLSSREANKCSMIMIILKTYLAIDHASIISSKAYLGYGIY